MSRVEGKRESWRVWWGRLTPGTLTPDGGAKQGLCSEALTPSGLVRPPEMGPSPSPSPTPQTPLSRPRMHAPAPVQNQSKYKLTTGRDLASSHHRCPQSRGLKEELVLWG